MPDWMIPEVTTVTDWAADAAPPSDTDHVFTVTTDESRRLQWVLLCRPQPSPHGDDEDDDDDPPYFHPHTSWKTSTPGTTNYTTDDEPQHQEVDDDDDANMPVELSFYIPHEARRFVWGPHWETLQQPPNIQNALEYRNSLRIPTIYLYIVSSSSSSNSTTLRYDQFLAKIFRGVPVMIHKLASDSFLRGGTRVSPVLSTTSHHHRHDNDGGGSSTSIITPDRAAKFAAVQDLYPETTTSDDGSSCCLLLIDCGAIVLTYTCAEPVKEVAVASTTTTTTDHHDHPSTLSSSSHSYNNLVGGTGAGFRMKFRACHDYGFGRLPDIDRLMVAERIDRCETEQAPLKALEALQVLDGSSNNSDDGRSPEEDWKDSIMGMAFLESTILLSHVIRNWLSKQPAASTRHIPTVVLTGDDMDIYYKLLMPNHCNIIKSPSPVVQEILEGGFAPEDPFCADIPAHKRFRIVKQKYLVQLAVAKCLNEAHASLNHFSEDDGIEDKANAGVESLRQLLLGQRVVATVKRQAFYGTIISVNRSESNLLEEDQFAIWYDANGAVDDLRVDEIYGMLLEYHRRGPEESQHEDDKMRFSRKQKDAKKVADTLEANQLYIRQLIKSRQAKKKRHSKSSASPVGAARGRAEKRKRGSGENEHISLL